MANFDDKNDKIKERGTRLGDDLKVQKPWKPTAYDDCFVSTLSSKR